VTRVLLTGAGGPAAIGVARSLGKTRNHLLVGVDCDPHALLFAPVDARYVVPRCSDPLYLRRIQEICETERIDFLHAQPDSEVRFFSEHRKDIGARVLLPAHETVVLCQDKYATNRQLLGTGVPIPKTILLTSPEDVWGAEGLFGEEFWVRDRVGAAGRGAWHVKASQATAAVEWVNVHDGWGGYIASEYLPGRILTWQSVWKNGELLSAQGRERLGWAMADRSPSGVTGVTGIARTTNRQDVADIGRRCVLALERAPNGIFGVDMKEGTNGVPRVTEVNIGRFFTTIQFFTELGLNMPDLYVRAGMGDVEPDMRHLPENWYWIRSMDCEPKLVRGKDIV